MIMSYLYPLFAADPKNCADESKCVVNLPSVAANQSQVTSALAIVFGTFAAVAVIVIIIAAINFANTEGDPEKIARAKRTIIFALVGLVIAISAEAVVLTIVNRL